MKGTKMLLGSLAALSLAFGLSACGTITGQVSSSSENASSVAQNSSNSYTQQEILTMNIVYAKAQDLGFQGTLDEFMEICKGKDGVAGKDGEDGVGIRDIYLNSASELVVILSDNTIQNLGSVKGEKGDKGEQGEKGEQGVGVSKAEINADGELVLYYSNAPTVGVVIGKVVGEDGKDGEDGEDALSGMGIATIEVNNSNQLIVELNNGLRLICDATGLASGSYESVSMGVDRVIYVTKYGIKASIGTLASAELDADGCVVLTLSDSRTLSLGKIQATGGAVCQHIYSEWIVGEAATCESIGYKLRTCGNCGVIQYDFIPSLGHVWGNYYIMEEPTQQKDGLVLHICDDCGVTKAEFITADGDEDKDGLSNYEEICVYHTDPFKEDTDEDGLSDYQEVMTYSTNPLDKDTDGDGCSDGKEVSLGFDPLVAQEKFCVILPYEPAEESNDTVKPSIAADLDGEQVESLSITQNDFFEENTKGYMGAAYDYNVEGEVENATISFAFEENTVSSATTPTIYQFDKDQKTLKPLPTTVNDGVATTQVEELSTFVLLDRTVLEASHTWVDVWGVGNACYTDLEIVFVIDDSGSLGGDYGYNSSTGYFTSGNDPTHERLKVAREFIAELTSSAKVGVVKFDSNVYSFTNSLVTCDASGKTQLNNILQFTYKSSYSSSENYVFDSKGTTYMYGGINKALTMFSSSASETTLQAMIVLTDGDAHDISLHSSTIAAAKQAGVFVYTVGLGSTTSYFTNYLKPLAEQTGAKFYTTANADGLSEIYEDVGEKIDLTTDLDGDGLSDYYEKNPVDFGGITFGMTDPSKADTDGDGLLDGEEVVTVTVYNADGTKMTILGKVYSDPTKADSDGDGYNDDVDRFPMNPNRH